MTTKRAAGTKKTAKKKAAKQATTKKKATAKKASKKPAAKKKATAKKKTSATKKTAAKKKTAKKAPATKKATKKAPATKKATKKAPATKAPATKKAAKKTPAQAGLLAPDVEKALLAQLKKANYEHQVEQALEKLVPDGLAHADVLWDLAQRGRLPLDRAAVADEFMEYAAPSPEALQKMWSGFKPEWANSLPTQLPGAPSFLFGLAYEAIGKDAAPWLAAADSLPEPLRGVVWLEIADHGIEVPPAVRDELRERLLTDPFDDSRVCTVANLQIFGIDDETIARELLQRLPAEGGPSPSEVELVLRHADLDVVARILGGPGPTSQDIEIARRVLRARTDDAAALTRLATKVRAAQDRDDDTDRLVQAIVDVALERFQAAGEVPPAELDALVTFAWNQSNYVSPALAALPRERLQAIVRRELGAGEPYRRTRVFPALRHAFDDELFGEVLALAREAVTGSTSRANQEPLALGAIGLQAIPALERALAAAQADTTFERDYHKNRWLTQLRKAIAVALLDDARAGRPIEEKWDALLGPHPECLDWNIIDEVFNGGRLFGELLAALPEARTRAILDAWLAADPNAQHDVRSSLKHELPDSIKHLLAPAETVADRLRRMVAATGLQPDTRIYVLEPDEDCEPASPNRTCSAPLGLPDDRWPRHTKKGKQQKMEHVLTIDLDQAPELRRRAPAFASARALALFISSRNENEAWTPENGETELVGLTEEELAAGHDEDGGSFAVHALDVPGAVFGDAEKGTPLGELRSALWKLHGRALGEPYWVQSDEWFGQLLLQFDEGLAYINLGDSGVMYVFDDTAFWQCY